MIVTVYAVGRYLDRHTVQQHGDCTVLDAGIDQAIARKHAVHLLGQGACCQVIVVRGNAAQEIAHTAADQKALVARRGQTIQHGKHLRGE